MALLVACIYADGEQPAGRERKLAREGNNSSESR